MKPILILYATREGQTRRIAERIATMLEARGEHAQAVNAASVNDEIELSDYSAALLAASVHGGKHEPELVKFVKRHRNQLGRLPTAFISVSLSEAGAEDEARSSVEREESRQEASRFIDDFIAQTNWNAEHVTAVAGSLPYTQCNFFMRFIMKMIVKRQGGSTDTSRDHEYTDWQALENFVAAFLYDSAEGRARANASATAQPNA